MTACILACIMYFLTVVWYLKKTLKCTPIVHYSSKTGVPLNMNKLFWHVLSFAVLWDWLDALGPLWGEGHSVQWWRNDTPTVLGLFQGNTWCSFFMCLKKLGVDIEDYFSTRQINEMTTLISLTQFVILDCKCLSISISVVRLKSETFSKTFWLVCLHKLSFKKVKLRKCFSTWLISFDNCKMFVVDKSNRDISPKHEHSVI